MRLEYKMLNTVFMRSQLIKKLVFLVFKMFFEYAYIVNRQLTEEFELSNFLFRQVKV